jgi:Amt family ammonium transporter
MASLRRVIQAGGIVLGLPALAGAQAPDSRVVADTLWVLIAGMLVFFMNAGFALLETGFCRAKNAVSLLAKNFVVFGVASLSFWALGFGLMFGEGGLVGRSGFLLLGPDNSPATGEAYAGVFPSLGWAGVPLMAKFFFQLVFAGTAATIVSGAVAERARFSAFLVFSFLNTAVLYPTVGHWIWGGGFLSGWGFYDFAGSTVVHSVGGWAALAGVIVLGPRLGRYRKDGKVNAIPGHNMALATMGALILWLGWFGFNPGSTMAADPERIARIAVVTNMGAAGGTIAALLTAWLLFGRPDLSLILNGTLGGLVAVTAGCAWVTPAGATTIGLIAGVLAVVAIPIMDRLRLDDPVGALAVHLVNGVWGTLAVGLFAAPPYAGVAGAPPSGLLYHGSGELLLVQAKGALLVAGFMLPASLMTWAVIRALMGLRVDPAEEAAGLDTAEMGMEVYPAESLVSVQTLLDTSLVGRRRQPPAPVGSAGLAGLGLAPFTVAFSTPAPAFGPPSAPAPPVPRGAGSRPGRGGPEGPDHAAVGGNGGGQEKPSGPNPAVAKRDSRRFTVVLENIDLNHLARRWRELCRRPLDEAPPEFREVYPLVASLSGNAFRCVGGEPEAVRRCFERIFQGHGNVGTVVRVVL